MAKRLGHRIGQCPHCAGPEHGLTEPCPKAPTAPLVEIDLGPSPAAALAWIGIAVGLFGLFQAGVLLIRCLGR